MNIVFLRGSVPPANEHPEKLKYKTINNCEDMWTQLFYNIVKKSEKGSQGEILYVNGRKDFRVNKFFRERWVNNLANAPISFMPDLIFCRGGFPYYDDFVKRFPKAKKIYYGAGRRFFPQTSYTNYDLFLVDSPKQREKIRKKRKNVHLFIKPAARLFKPDKKASKFKKYDICFIANATQAKIKRHEFFLNSFSGSQYKILNIGITGPKLKKKAQLLKVNITWDDWHLRKKLPKLISQCKVGICCSTNYDSCPRVISEYLACDVPVVATSNINFWHKKYINEQTGILVEDDGLVDGVKYCIDNKIKPHAYYRDHLSMQVAAKYILGLIKNICE